MSNFLIRIKHSLIFACLLSALFFLPYEATASTEEAIFAGGCFWCLEHDLESLPGVLSVESGYTGGSLDSPTYRQHDGHQEAVLVRFDTSQIEYKKLLRAYWRNVDPFDDGGQFCDRGDSYRPVIFTQSDLQAAHVTSSFDAASMELAKSLGSLKVEQREAATFWPAESYHQDFAELNNFKYSYYRLACGRDRRLDEVWGDKARQAEAWGSQD